jgi:hypothetical protein
MYKDYFELKFDWFNCILITSISFVFVWLLFPLLPVSVDWSFSIALSVFSNVYFQYIYDLRGSILPAIVQEYQHGRCKLHLYIICIAKLPSTLTTDIHVVFSSWLCFNTCQPAILLLLVNASTSEYQFYSLWLWSDQLHHWCGCEIFRSLISAIK